MILAKNWGSRILLVNGNSKGSNRRNRASTTKQKRDLYPTLGVKLFRRKGIASKTAVMMLASSAISTVENEKCTDPSSPLQVLLISGLADRLFILLQQGLHLGYLFFHFFRIAASLCYGAH